jgi:hypothetical protein
MAENPGIPEELDWVGLSGKRAKGRRPSYFDDPAIDQVVSIVMALVGEVSVLRERNNTLERLLEERGLLARSDIENYVPEKVAAEERGRATMEYVSRVMRGPQQAVEALKKPDRPIGDWIDELGKS